MSKIRDSSNDELTNSLESQAGKQSSQDKKSVELSTQKDTEASVRYNPSIQTDSFEDGLSWRFYLFYFKWKKNLFCYLSELLKLQSQSSVENDKYSKKKPSNPHIELRMCNKKKKKIQVSQWLKILLITSTEFPEGKCKIYFAYHFFNLRSKIFPSGESR